MLSIWTLDFGSGHDLGVLRSSPTLGSALGAESAWASVSPCPLLLPPFVLSLSNK